MSKKLNLYVNEAGVSMLQIHRLESLRTAVMPTIEVEAVQRGKDEGFTELSGPLPYCAQCRRDVDSISARYEFMQYRIYRVRCHGDEQRGIYLVGDYSREFSIAANPAFTEKRQPGALYANGRYLGSTAHVEVSPIGAANG